MFLYLSPIINRIANRQNQRFIYSKYCNSNQEDYDGDIETSNFIQDFFIIRKIKENLLRIFLNVNIDN